jgi:hypothetical protein
VFALSRGVKIAFVLQLLVLAGAVVVLAVRWREQTSEPPTPAIPAPVSAPDAGPPPGDRLSLGSSQAGAETAPSRGIGDDRGGGSTDADGTQAERAPAEPVLPDEGGGPMVLEASTAIPSPTPAPNAQEALEPGELRPAPEPAVSQRRPPEAARVPQPARAPSRQVHALPQPRPRPARFAPGTPERPLIYVRGLEVWEPDRSQHGSSPIVHWSGRQPVGPARLLQVSFLDTRWFGGATHASSRPFERGYQSVAPSEGTLSAFLVIDADLPGPEPPQRPTLTAGDAPQTSPDRIETAEAGRGDGPRGPPPSMLYADGACV